MTNRNEKILLAAKTVFLRYGVKRTTMNDIAQEAGVSRQTLYNAFSNKEEIFSAIVRDFHEGSIASARLKCADLTSLADKLDTVLYHMVLLPYDEISTSPHARDIIEGITVMARDELLESKKDYVRLIESVLSQEANLFEGKSFTVNDVSELIFCAGEGAKDYSESREQLQKVLITLRRLICDIGR